jgi:dTDP-4-dehydrorhamnose 3,5-epimerase
LNINYGGDFIVPFTFQRLEIKDTIVIEPLVFGDDRGFFMETYKASEFSRNGIKGTFVQDNHSRSGQGILRGLHYQNPPYAQGKLVRAVRGEIYDVAVDIRKESGTFGKWLSVILSEKNRKILYLPEGFAHGFCVLSDLAEVVYKTTSDYAPEAEAGIIWNDEDLKIEWPVKKPVLSNKDQNWPAFKDAGIG